MLGKGIELPLPEGPVARDPEGGASHRPSHETAALDAAVSLPSQQPRVLQDPEVLGDGWEGHVEGLGQGRHRGLAPRQALQDRAPGRIGQGGKGGVEGGR